MPPACSSSRASKLYIICSYFKSLKSFYGALQSISRKLLIKSRNQNTAALTSTQKIQIFEIQNPKNTPLIPVCIYAKSTPWGLTLVHRQATFEPPDLRVQKPDDEDVPRPKAEYLDVRRAQSKLLYFLGCQINAVFLSVLCLQRYF